MIPYQHPGLWLFGVLPHYGGYYAYGAPRWRSVSDIAAGAILRRVSRRTLRRTSRPASCLVGFRLPRHSTERPLALPCPMTQNQCRMANSGVVAGAFP